MRNLIGLVVGLYLTCALVAFATAAWTFNTDDRWKAGTCTNPDWLPWAAYRAIAWPKTFADEQNKVNGDIVAWLTVQYAPTGLTCS
jgi:hypothetical protein